MSDQNSVDNFGKAFWYIAWILALLFLTLLFQSILDSKANPNTNPESSENASFSEVILKRNDYNAYLSSGRVNGEPAIFIVDTGATQVAVPEHLAKQYGMKKGRSITVSTANGLAQAFTSEIAELSIGKITLYNVRANISPGFKEDGILLGMSALKQLEFTQRGDTLTLRKYH